MSRRALAGIIGSVGLTLCVLAAYRLFLTPTYHSATGPSNASSPGNPQETSVSEDPEEAADRSGIPERPADSATARSGSDTPTEPALPVSLHPLHTDITATVFWVGEPEGNGSSEDNALSAWDDSWQEHYGCFDDPYRRDGYYPKGCVPKENPFYFDLPYDDFDWDDGNGRRKDAMSVVPWAKTRKWEEDESMLKNRWIMITKDDVTCYAQWEDAGPYVYDDVRYVFGRNDERPKNEEANGAGMDVSPAVRDCLGFEGENTDTNKVSWRFVETSDVPDGPWKRVITTSGTYWK